MLKLAFIVLFCLNSIVLTEEVKLPAQLKIRSLEGKNIAALVLHLPIEFEGNTLNKVTFMIGDQDKMILPIQHSTSHILRTIDGYSDVRFWSTLDDARRITAHITYINDTCDVDLCMLSYEVQLRELM